MQRKHIILTAAMVAGLMLGIIVGPTLRSMVTSAQAQPPTQTQPPTQSQPAAPGGSLANLFLDKLAAALQIQRSALDSAITSAGTSAADTAVQQGTLTQAQADALKARIQAGDLGALWGGRGGFEGGRQLGNVKQAMVDAAAKALKITTTELLTQLRNGQTLAQLAQAHGTTEQAVTSAALGAAKTQLDQAVASGTLTQAQANAIYAQLQQRGAQLLTPRGRGFRGRGRQGALTTPQAPTAPAPTT